jgi:hypothetical protein
MKPGTIQNPTQIYMSAEGDCRILAWEQTKALLPGFEPHPQIVLTSEILDPDPLEGGWMADDFIELERDEAVAVRGAIDAFLTPDGLDISHLTKHGLTEGERSLLIESGFNCADSEWDGNPAKLEAGWTLTDEHGEEIWISPSRLTWLATIAPQLLAAYKAALAKAERYEEPQQPEPERELEPEEVIPFGERFYP